MGNDIEFQGKNAQEVNKVFEMWGEIQCVFHTFCDDCNFSLQDQVQFWFYKNKLFTLRRNLWTERDTF